MPGIPNWLIGFWQELKRRKVFRVTATYAATAYIIIEVLNNLAVPLQLPYWVSTLVLIILAVGLPVAVILSWIFDFTPQGIRKTESLENLDKNIVKEPAKRRLRASEIIIAVLFISVIILAWPKIFKRDAVKRLGSSGERLSIAIISNQQHKMN